MHGLDRRSSGAGTFGASLAWWLARDGVRRSTLVDQFEPGDARATSGGETRLIRCGHGADALLHRLRAPRAHAVARARGGVRRGRCWSSAAWRGSPTREDGWEAASERDDAPPRASRTSGSSAEEARAAVPELRAATTSRSCSTSRRPACCARSGGARARRAGGGARRAAGARPRASPDGDRGRGSTTARALEADAVVWACGGWLARLFAERRDRRVDAPGAVLLRRRPGVAAPGVPGWVDYDGAIYGTGDLDGLGVKAAPDFEGPPLEPDAPLPPASSAGRRRWSATYLRRPLPGARRRAAEVVHDVPLRAVARLALHRRPAPRARARVAARRRLRPRLQARPGDGRADGAAWAAGRRCPPSGPSAPARRGARCARRAHARSRQWSAT